MFRQNHCRLLHKAHISEISFGGKVLLVLFGNGRGTRGTHYTCPHCMQTPFPPFNINTKRIFVLVWHLQRMRSAYIVRGGVLPSDLLPLLPLQYASQCCNTLLSHVAALLKRLFSQKQRWIFLHMQGHLSLHYFFFLVQLYSNQGVSCRNIGQEQLRVI